MPRTLGLGVADDDEFLLLRHLDFCQRPAIAGRVGRVDPLRDDPFGLHSARRFKEPLAVTEMMVAVVNSRRCSVEELLQALLPVEERPLHQVVTVEKEQVEGEEDQMHAAALIRRGLHLRASGRMAHSSPSR